MSTAIVVSVLLIGCAFGVGFLLGVACCAPFAQESEADEHSDVDHKAWTELSRDP